MRQQSSSMEARETARSLGISGPAPALLAILAGILVYVLGTWRGIGLRPDSVIYLGFWDEGRQQAPLYTRMMDLGALGGADRMVVAWWLNLALLACNLVLVHAILARCSVRPLLSALALVALVLLPQFAYVHQTVLSEPVSILTLLATLALLAGALREGGMALVVAAGLMGAAAVLARFASAPLIGAGALALLFYAPGTWRERLLRAVVFAAIASVLFLGWMAWSRAAGGAGVDRELAFNGTPGREVFLGALDTLSAYVLPSFLPGLVRRAAVAGMAALLVLLMTVLLPLRRGAIGRVEAASEAGAATALAFMRPAMLFVALYVPFVVLTLFIEHGLHVHARYVLPVYVILLMVTLVRFGRAGAEGSDWSMPARLLLAGLVAIVVLNGLRGTVATYQLMREGNFYTSDLWAKSPVIGAAGNLDPGLRIYSNAPVAIRLLARRPAEFWPRHYDYRTGKAFPGQPFDAELAQVVAEVRAGKAVLVAVDQADWRPYMASEWEIVAALGLQPASRRKDGRIYAAPSLQVTP